MLGAGVNGWAPPVCTAAIQRSTHVCAAFAATYQASKDVDVFPNMCFTLGVPTTLVSLQDELDAGESLSCNCRDMMILDLYPLYLVTGGNALSIIVNIVEIIAGIENIAQDLMYSRCAPFHAAPSTQPQFV